MIAVDDLGYGAGMTTSPNQPAEFSARHNEGAEAAAADQHESMVEDESELATGGYDDRQESLEESDRDLFARKQRDPDARYRPEDEPKDEPRKQPRQQD